jgi:hypothetical protein
MSTSFNNAVIKNIGPTPVTVVTIASNARATVIGLSLTNLTTGNVMASVQVNDGAGNTGYFCYNIIVPPNTSLRAVSQGEKLILGSSNSLLISADQAGALDALVSYVTIV